MKVAVIISKANTASLNIRECLLKLYPFRDGKLSEGGQHYELHEYEKEIIHLENIDKGIEADVLVFASTHKSSAAIDCFTAHSIGNWGKAELGGLDGKLVPSPAGLIKSAIKILSNNSVGMEAIQEATHHGPYLEKPAMFIEIGSSPKMYESREAGETVAMAIIQAAQQEKETTTAVGIGGPHHSPNFRKLMLESDIAVGHICAKYALESLNESMLRQAMEKTLPKASKVLIDWKGLGSQKGRIRKFIDDAGISWEKI